MRWTTFNRFEFEMPEEAVQECHHQGQCDEDVSYWQGKIDLSHISDADLKAELEEYGAWENSELQNRKTNEERIIWLAAGNIQDYDTMDCEFTQLKPFEWNCNIHDCVMIQKQEPNICAYKQELLDKESK